MHITETLEEESPTLLLAEDFEPLDHELTNHEVNQRLLELLAKLRSYMDPGTGAYAEGVDIGMAMAADMLETVILELQGK